MWSYDPVSNTWNIIMGGNTSYSTLDSNNITGYPGARIHHAFLYTYSNIFLYGGFGFGYERFENDSQGYLNDLWKFDILSNQWSLLSGNLDAFPTDTFISLLDYPTGTDGVLMNILNESALILLGDSVGFIVWIYNIETNEWHNIINTETYINIPRDYNLPIFRDSHLISHNGNIYLFGGQNGQGINLF